ncbi:MAG: anti-sigma factor [Oscillatoriales cyanobacterium SM2_3_0]|nr:anti-sigma factor [Oscillatoriales cyanobacterium SM2_3_0]
MNQSMTPEQLQLLIAGYVLNDLNDEEATVMEGLLEDAEILQAIDQMQFALEAAYAPEEIQPSPQLRTGIMNAATGTQALDRVDLQGAQSINPDLASLSIGALPRWLKVLGTLAALLIAGLSLSNYVMWRSLRIQQARLQSEPLVFSLQPTANVAPTSKVVLQVNPDTLRGTLKIDNLPPLEPGKVYVLWTVLAPDAPFTTDPKMQF